MAVLRAVVGMVLVVGLAARARADSALPFEVENGRTAAGLAFAAAPGTWTRSIRLVVTGEAKLTTAKLAIVDPIRLETDAGDVVRLQPTTIPLQDALPGVAIPVELTGSFVKPGLYKGELVLVQAGKPRVVALQVTVALPAKLALPVARHGGTVVELSSGEIATIPLALARTGDDKLSVNVTVLGVSQLDRAENPTVRATVGGDIGGTQVADLATNHVVTLGVPIAGVTEPGIYEIESELRDGRDCYLPATITTLVFRRAHWFWAALSIFVGALAAFLIRRYLDGGADQLSARRSLALLAGQIRAARGGFASDALITAARSLELDVEDQQRFVRWGGKAEDLKKAQARAQQRFQLLIEIAAATVQVERLDSDRQAAARTVLDDALVLVRLDPGPSADDKSDPILAQRELVQQLGNDTLWRDQLSTELAQLEAQLAIRLPGARSDLVSALKPLGLQLADVRAELNRGQLAEAASQLERARATVLGVFTDELEHVAKDANPPVGVASIEWQAFPASIADAVAGARDVNATWSKRRAEFASAQAAYLKLAATGLIARAETKLAGPPTPPPEVQRKLAAIADELRRALADPMSVAPMYTRCLSAIEAAAGPTMMAPVGARGIAPEVMVAASFGPAAVRPDAESLPEVVRWSRAVGSTMLAVNGALLVIAVASGIQALWLPNRSWGGGGAMVIAFLWGAGVQAAGNLFTGILALRTKLGALVT